VVDEKEDKTLAAIRQVESILEKIFGERLSKIEASDKKRIAIAELLENDNNFKAKDPNLALIQFIRDTWKSTNNFLLFLRSLRAKKTQMQIFESELSASLLRELKRTEAEFGDERDFNALIDLYIRVITFAEKDYVIGYLKTPPHPIELQNAINKIKNIKIANRVREIIDSLTNEEIDYLMKYHAEVNSWNDREAITEDIQFFTAKISSFLYGRGEKYRGLFTDFKDKKLEQIIKSNPAYLQLTRYNLMILYLRRKIRDKIATYTTGDWTQFEEVYNNLKKIADKFISLFGNADIPSELFNEKKEFREYPERWLQDIDKKLAEISSVQYRKTNVIFPFIREMEKIFSSRIDELKNRLKPEIVLLKDALKPLVNLEKDSATNVFRAVAQYNKKLKKKIGNLKREFDVLANSCTDAMIEYMEAKSEIIDNIFMREVGVRWKNLNIYAKNESQHSDFVEKVIGDSPENLVMDISKMFKVLFSLEKAYRAGMKISDNLNMIFQFFTRNDTLKQVRRLSISLSSAEEVYANLEKFISQKLNFLNDLGQSKERRKQDGRTTTTR